MLEEGGCLQGSLRRLTSGRQMGYEGDVGGRERTGVRERPRAQLERRGQEERSLKKKPPESQSP